MLTSNPASPPEPDAVRPGFLEAMRYLSHSVTVVATDGPAGRGGATATAMASVSADGDAPTLLVCLNQASHSAKAVLGNGVFTLNVLGEDGEAISNIFAARHVDGHDKFDGLDWEPAGNGAPILKAAVSVFECRVAESHLVSTHHVIVGAVTAVRLIRPGPTLVYGDRRYGRFAPFG
jgi:flavin reductase